MTGWIVPTGWHFQKKPSRAGACRFKSLLRLVAQQQKIHPLPPRVERGLYSKRFVNGY
ncbi:hypothetical protein NYR54_02785 [Chelativorans sp. SCAU2101]|uniref:Uncharacterized protein n=1 Tax=Chelativorans petroleitrophicus TaxID=2975484 RepID=A0A9X3B5T2_9HYPH|nr:hypothetical protein [Chelativorans petroleitrophicus]MCT8989227.1 hypothetical protein [Chelativorans petroleitrophicus]